MGDRKPESSEKDREGEDTTTVSPTAPPAGPEATTSGATSGDGVDNADAGDTAAKSSRTLKERVAKVIGSGTGNMATRLSELALSQSGGALQEADVDLQASINPDELRPADVFVPCDFKKLSDALSGAPGRGEEDATPVLHHLPAERTDSIDAGRSANLRPGEASCCWYGGRSNRVQIREPAKRDKGPQRTRSHQKSPSSIMSRPLPQETLKDRLFGGDVEQGEDEIKQDLVYSQHAGLRDHLSRLRTLMAPGGTIHPNSIFRKSWDLVQLAILIYISIVIPIRVGFEKPAYGAAFIVDIVIDVLFFTDIGFNFFTGYYDASGDIELRGRELRIHYLKTWFIVDALSSLPVDYFVRAAEGNLGCSFTSCLVPVEDLSSIDSTADGRLFRLIRILRMTKLFKLLRVARMRQLLEKYQSNSIFFIAPALSVAKQVMVLIFLGHMLGCFFYYFSLDTWWTSNEITLVSEGLIVPWIDAQFYGQADRVPATPLGAGAAGFACPPGYRLQDIGVGIECGTMFSLGIRYVSSLYWSFATTTTVGYGDIAGVTLAERLYCIFALIIGGFVFSSIIGRMGALLSQLESAKSAATNRQLDGINSFLRDIKLPPALRGPVLGFFRRQRVREYQPREVLSQLPFDLRCRVVKFMYEDDIRLTPIMGMRNDDLFFTDICMRLNAYSIQSFSYVYKRGETSSDIFILLRGELAVIDVDLDTIVCKVTRGAVFGLSSVLDVVGAYDFRPKRRENVYSLSNCHLLRITLEDFLELIVTYPDILPHLIDFHEEFEKITTTSQSKVAEAVTGLLADVRSDNFSADGDRSPKAQSFSKLKASARVSESEMLDASRRAMRKKSSDGNRTKTMAQTASSHPPPRPSTLSSGNLARNSASGCGDGDEDAVPPPGLAAILAQVPADIRSVARRYSKRSAAMTGRVRAHSLHDAGVIADNGAASSSTYMRGGGGPQIQGGLGFSALATSHEDGADFPETC